MLAPCPKLLRAVERARRRHPLGLCAYVVRLRADLGTGAAAIDVRGVKTGEKVFTFSWLWRLERLLSEFTDHDVSVLALPSLKLNRT